MFEYEKILFALLALAVSAFALDINTASAEEFVKVKGIGEKKTERIISYRNEHGKFNSIDELTNVKGIGKKIVAIIKSES
ncbi:MAG TPA: helix-hairpin-helix domain-containing protein [Campylobacterales bacterium]|nr:helix-hairpin-helix domain-containing protein [Campylobacterales bacterium]